MHEADDRIGTLASPSIEKDEGNAMSSHAVVERPVSVASFSSAASPATSPTTSNGAFSEARTRAQASHGLSWADRATLAVIALVVVLVSMPRLRRFALRENEADAVRMLRLLAAEMQALEPLSRELDLGALVAQDVRLRERLEDVEVLEGGALRRHGYLFDVAKSAAGERFLRAWPWEHDHTGIGAFLLIRNGDVLGNSNREGRFSGAEHPPLSSASVASGGWVAMPRM